MFREATVPWACPSPVFLFIYLFFMTKTELIGEPLHVFTKGTI